MTQIPFQTSKGEFLAVLPDENEYDFAGIVNNSFYYHSSPNFRSVGDYPYSFPLPQGNWQPLGFAKEVSEEVWKGIVLNHEYPFMEGQFCYPDYEVYGKEGFKAFDNATDSGLSLLKENEVYLVNPYSHPSDIEPTNRNHYDSLTEQWQKAQENTGNWCILKLVE